MNTLKTTTLVLLLALVPMSGVAEQDNTKQGHAELKAEATAFFHTYLNAYNKRFGHPENKASFLEELSGLIHNTFIMAPLTSAPFQPDSPERLGGAFDGFVQSLEEKGAIKLQWQEINLRVLTPAKILANNVGYAVNKQGERVYETISVYLLYRDQRQWKIVLFSPYDFDNKLAF